MDEFEWAKSFSNSFSASSYGTRSSSSRHNAKDGREGPPNAISQPPQGSFSSFICHVIHLERKLRAFNPIILNGSSNIKHTGRILGLGKTFLVRHAEWMQKPNEPPVEVALKEIIPTFQSTSQGSTKPSSASHRPDNDWKDILFELRALLHEPIRYHPNLVRLLGIQWGLSPLTESVYPMLVMECSSLGTFQTFQASVEPLPFSTKQKLCYDVGKGLSALHACGIVHGDMKHENVLIFPNNDSAAITPFMAKLADFGGTIMGLTEAEVRKMETWTWPFQAPEVDRAELLTRDGMMLTDVYSFGLLVWRAFTDGDGFVSFPGAAQSASDEAKHILSVQKSTHDFTRVAIAEVAKYAESRTVPQDCVNVVVCVILHTIRLQPSNRNLASAQVALRGVKLGKINGYMDLIREKNNEQDAMVSGLQPGSHGVTQDSRSIMRGREGHYVDLQENLPGYRPKLEEPNMEELLFEPESLRSILTWHQQQQMLEELKEAAGNTNGNTNTLIGTKRTVAAFYLFQCYLLEFGTTFDSNEVLHWLTEAASDSNSHEDADYFAQAWIWRISRALGADANIPRKRVEALLELSAMRGHRICLQDILELASGSDGQDSREWTETYLHARNFLQDKMGSVGMGYFYTKFMTRTFILDDIDRLDDQIRDHLQQDYPSCVKLAPNDESRITSNGTDGKRTAFDDIFINRRGHGLLHFAAATGASNALRHMVTKYKCDINLRNLHVDETPLVCACSGGKVACAMFLIENGADPNGYSFSQEGPLHWLSSFLPNEMENVASRLIAAGADIELRSGGMRHDVRVIRADWEHIFEIRVTPLGRAVLMNNLAAVNVLLKHGANPLAKTANKHRGQWEPYKNMITSKIIDVSSAFDLAAVLTLPDILESFIKHIDNSNGGQPSPHLMLLDETSMLELAHSKKATKLDPLSLQSRLVRCGANYKNYLRRTITILDDRGRTTWDILPSEEVLTKRSKVLSREVLLGNIDIVECLLDIGYEAKGTKDFYPLEKAIELNHVDLFHLLIKHGADATVTRPTAAGHISMLHVCASRPRQSRPGRIIADTLITSGVPIESVDPRCKSPLAMAVLNQNFDVARALLEHGADINASYPIQFNGVRGPETRSINLLVEVLAQHTMRTLESLRFLFSKEDSGSSQRPDFIIDKDKKLSIFHLLAGSEQFTEIAQITPMILNLCLDTYSESSFINYRHPLLGTALYYAAMNGNKVMVERLLERGAETSNSAGPDMSNSIQLFVRGKETWTPLWAAFFRLDDELNKHILDSSDHELNSKSFQNIEKTVEILLHTGDELAMEAMLHLAEKKSRLLAKQMEDKAMEQRARLEYKADRTHIPIDLSGFWGRIDSDVEKALLDVQEVDWIMPEWEDMLAGLRL